MRNVLLVLVILLTGCESKAQQEHDQYDLIAASSMAAPEDRCIAAKRVADAYAAAGDAVQYDEWRVKQSIDCQSAHLATYKSGY